MLLSGVVDLCPEPLLGQGFAPSQNPPSAVLLSQGAGNAVSVVGHGEPPLLPGCAARDALELLRLCWETRPGQQQGRKGCSAVKEMLEKQEGARAESTALQPCGRGGGERVGPGRGRGAGRAQGGGATPEISTAPVRAGRRHFACFFSF